MYYARAGVIQNNVYAHMWLNIAASFEENKNATKNRDIAAKRMTLPTSPPHKNLPVNVPVNNTKSVELELHLLLRYSSMPK